MSSYVSRANLLPPVGDSIQPVEPSQAAVPAELPVTLDELRSKEHWQGVINKARHAAQANMLDALSGIHQSVVEEIESLSRFAGRMPEFPKALLDIYLRFARALPEAKALPLGEARQVTYDFAQATGRIVEWFRDNRPNEGASKPVGALADAIFQRVTDTVSVPLVADLLSRFVKQAGSSKDHAQVTALFTDTLLDVIAEERRFTAETARHPMRASFGARMRPDAPHMHDDVNNPMYLPWKKTIEGKMMAALTREWHAFVRANPKGTFMELLYSKKQIAQGKGFAEFPSADGTFVVRLDLSKLPLSGSIRSNPDRDDVSHYEFGWATEGDAARRLEGPIRIANLTCIHPHTESRIACESIASNAVAALDWKQTDGLNALKREIGAVIFKMSHSSTFMRGQASITEMLCKALAGHHGFRLEFSGDWTAPSHPSPDNWALSEFDMESFIMRAIDNVNLTAVA